jgi:hypothetical protein
VTLVAAMGGGGDNRRSERRACILISNHLAGVLAFSNFFSCNSVIFIGDSFVCETCFLAYFKVFVTDILFYRGSYLHLMIFILTYTYLNMISESSKKRTIYDECTTFQFREGMVC